jgi:hypothetical protein
VDKRLSDIALEVAAQYSEVFDKKPDDNRLRMLIRDEVIRRIENEAVQICYERAVRSARLRIDPFIDKQVDEWMRDGEFFLSKPRPEVVRGIQQALETAVSSKRKVIPAARRKRIEVHRLRRRGMSPKDIAAKIGVGLPAVKRILAAARVEATQIKQDYLLYWGK